MTNKNMTQYPTKGQSRIRRQFSELLRLSFPVVLQRLGIMTMGIVDTMMVGRYSTIELAYQTIGYVPVAAIIVTSIGLMMGTMVLTSNAFGEEDFQKCGRIWRQSIPYGLVIGFIGFVFCMIGEPVLLLLGQEPEIAQGGGVVMQAIAFGIPMTTLMLACTFFLEGINRPFPGMIFMVFANIINIVANWALVYGHLGFDPMGAEGSAWATTFVRSLLAIAMVLYILNMKDHKLFGLREKVDMTFKKWKKLRHMGYAAGLTNGAEHMGFATLEVFAGWIGPITLGALAITFNIYGIPYMIAYGIAGATAVRVGIALGRRDHHDLMLAGSCGIALNGMVILPFMVLLLFMPEKFAHIFTTDPALINATVPLIILSAWMLLFDSSQTVAGNALRGRRDVWMPTILYFFSYLLVMIPLGYLLAFTFNHGANGLFESSVFASLISCILLIGRFYFLCRDDFKRPGSL